MNGYNYLDGLRKDFRKLFETGLFADARMICYENDENGEGEKKRLEIPVHRAILTARSKFFAAELADGKIEVEIQDFPAKMLKEIIFYVYSDRIPPTNSNLAESISLFKASEFFGLDIFMTEKIRSELVINDFPELINGEKNNPVVMSGGSRKRKNEESHSMVSPMDCCSKTLTDVCVKQRSTLIRMQIREETLEGNGATKKQKMHMDFLFEWRGSYSPQVFIHNLSLSILNSAGEKLKTVKREGYTSPEHSWIMNWRDCFDYGEIVNLIQRHRDPNRATSRNRQQPPAQLVVLCEATVIVKKSEKSSNFSNDDEGRTVYQNNFAALLETGRYSDARIVCYERPKGKKEANEWEKVMIPVHKCVLAVRSKFFAAAFSSGMLEAETGEVEIPPERGFPATTVRAMLSYTYTADVPQGMNQPTKIALFKAAHFYRIEGLMDVCVDLLNPSSTNCCDMLSLGKFYDCKALMKKTLEFMAEYGEEVKGKKAWRQLKESDDPNDEELKTLCGHWLGETPLTVENCAEVLRLCFDYGNAKLRKSAVFFMQGSNEGKVQATDGWRRLIEESEDAEALKRMIDEEAENITVYDDYESPLVDMYLAEQADRANIDPDDPWDVDY